MRSRKRPFLLPVPRPPHEEVISILEDLLAQAKAGDITGIAAVALQPGRLPDGRWSLQRDAAGEMLLGLRVLEERIVRAGMDWDLPYGLERT